jgi:hypothetical protein
LELAFSVIPNYLLPNAAAVKACDKERHGDFLHLSSWIGRDNARIRKFTNRPTVPLDRACKAAGPNGGQLYIDGFTAGQLPPKESIREIRINQTPFSAEYDKLSYGRIEVFTKPGTDKFHGQFLVDGNDSAFNSPNPFAGPEPGYDSTMFTGSVGGRINKNASFFLDFQRRNMNDLSAVNAITLDPTTLTETPLIQAVPFPKHRTNIAPRMEYQLGKNNTLTVRYQYYLDTEETRVSDNSAWLPRAALPLTSAIDFSSEALSLFLTTSA